MQIFSSDLLTLLNFKLSSFCSFAFCLTFALQIFALFFASATNPLCLLSSLLSSSTPLLLY
uniref:Uncharacterized protein n=1 Tax=Saccharolobus islandicus TaxID=43080 RepID=Q5W2V2_SACIS|nr:hypothetical protein [Sulfolobus islandicus]